MEQTFIQQFIANAVGHKVSSFLGGLAATLLAGITAAEANGLINVAILKPDWVQYLGYAVAVLTFLKGLNYNSNQQ